MHLDAPEPKQISDVEPASVSELQLAVAELQKGFQALLDAVVGDAGHGERLSTVEAQLSELVHNPESPLNKLKIEVGELKGLIEN